MRRGTRRRAQGSRKVVEIVEVVQAVQIVEVVEIVKIVKAFTTVHRD
jgi:hypothetical protein